MDQPTLTFLSDYGLADPFVGVCHAVVARVAPGVRIIDLTHGVPPQDVTVGAVLLADCVPFLPPPVTLAVVDPGVGTARRGVAVRAAGGHWFVGPDNGLLAPALHALGGAAQAWELDVDPAVPPTFHGRDVFAPAAARLALGTAPADLGRALDVATLQPLDLPAPEIGYGRLAATVLVVDRFGNLALGAGPKHLDAAGFRQGDRLRVGAEPAVLGVTFSDVAPGALVVLVDAAGHVAVAEREGSAAARLGAAVRTRLDISFAV